MIITLKGADFSGFNIGNIYNWNVSYVVGRGVTHSGATSVLKGDSFTVTFTISEGYELAETGVSVIMGEETLSNCTTVADNIIAIEIPEVTGNVIINVPTITSVLNLLDFSIMSSALRYSPSSYNIVSNSGTKYGLFTIQLDPAYTYTLKLSSGFTGGLFATEPIAGAKTTSDYNLSGSGAGTYTITPTVDVYWLALNIATNETGDGGTTVVTPTSVWQSALLYQNE